MIHRPSFIELHPVGSLRKKDQIAFITIIHAGTRHTVTERYILHAPHHQSSDAYARIYWDRRLIAERGAIPVDHGSHRAGLRPGFLIFFNILVCKSMKQAAAAQCTYCAAPIVGAHARFRQPWQLKEEDIPRTTQLLKVALQESFHHRRMWHIEDA